MTSMTRASDLLTAEQERELFLRWRDHADEAALDNLVRQFAPLIRSVVNRVRSRGCLREDMDQEGRVGFLKALKNFDPDRGFRLSTYARWWIRAEVERFVIATANVVNHPTTHEARHEFRRGRSRVSTVSIDAPAPFASRTEGSNTTIGDTFEAEEVDIDHQIDMDKFMVAARRAMETLNPREREVIERRILSPEEEILDTVGARLGVTGERVRQIQERALAKLRAAMSAQPNPILTT